MKNFNIIRLEKKFLTTFDRFILKPNFVSKTLRRQNVSNVEGLSGKNVLTSSNGKYFERRNISGFCTKTKAGNSFEISNLKIPEKVWTNHQFRSFDSM